MLHPIDLPRRLAAEALGTGLLVAAVVGSGVMAERLADGNVALALLANVVSAILVFHFRTGDANLRAVWLCSRNDALGNLAVIAAAAGVFASGTAWPDLVVGLGMAGLAVWAGASVIGQARGELRRADPAAAA